VPAIDRLGLAVALRHEARLGDALGYEVLLDRGGAVLGEREVGRVVTALVGVALDLEERESRGLPSIVAATASRIGYDAAREDRLIGCEVDVVEDLDGRARHDHAPAIGAAVRILEAVVRLGLVRAPVGIIGDAVVIHVGGRVGVALASASRGERAGSAMFA